LEGATNERCGCRGTDYISIEIQLLDINLSGLKDKIIAYDIKILPLLLLFIVV
jgi:hypothetical protein